LLKTENELINQRLTWLGTFQGLLHAALAFAWDKTDATALVWVLCILGMSVAFSTWVGTVRANKTIVNWGIYWDKVKPKDYTGPDVEGIRSNKGCFWWMMPGYALPFLFLAGWIAIAAVHHWRTSCK
jgi:hypothetical protein